jgi:hypothetical protein
MLSIHRRDFGAYRANVPGKSSVLVPSTGSDARIVIRVGKAATFR